VSENNIEVDIEENVAEMLIFVWLPSAHEVVIVMKYLSDRTRAFPGI
jgi:hypothetical protein